ncbi:ABC transporter ATP-binding protein [Ferviditalea candida]|uniref:ATP-binding cassette domain-containing protein n=1 Tax=Ferviditalea candida TaxID=3108399 RepID=A0ABU5ZJL8_9BACL|nr:ATP-binding cassette domain-containing protein [Paenibacillaceae bacterium T2]
MIQLQQIDFIREGRNILQQVSLTMNPYEHWVILGKNGSGKTTLLEMMCGYLFPTRGTIEVLGNRYGQCDVREVRKQLGITSQSLFEKLTPRDPVWEVVATGEYAYLRMYEQVSQELKEKAEAMLERLQIAHLQNQPLGTLSQGERKKVMLARSLMADPRVLIMDEPCSGLDLFEREKLLESLQRLQNQNLQIVYVTHHIEEIISLFTHVALIEQGRIVAAGPKREVLTGEHLLQTFQVPLQVEWFNDRPWIKVLQEL